MPATRHDLFARFNSLGIVTRTTEHAPVFTVAESDALHADMPGGHTKNLFLVDAKGGFWLVVAEAHVAVDLKALSKQLGAPRFSFGKPERLMDVLGVMPGSVTALAVINDDPPRCRVVVDARLMSYETINCHPLVNTATTALACDDLIRFLTASGHRPDILELPALVRT
jgi:Ala-tRNA(Pro) deacylase